MYSYLEQSSMVQMMFVGTLSKSNDVPKDKIQSVLCFYKEESKYVAYTITENHSLNS